MPCWQSENNVATKRGFITTGSLKTSGNPQVLASRNPSRASRETTCNGNSIAASTRMSAYFSFPYSVFCSPITRMARSRSRSRSSAVKACFLHSAFRFVIPSVRICVAELFPLQGSPFKNTFGPAILSTPCLARVSNICSSANSFSSLSLLSSSRSLRKTKR
jgi:hypothetical protein